MAKNDKILCTRCGSELAKTNFYKSNSELYNYKNKLPICRDCLDDLYNIYFKECNSEMKSIFKLCLKLDVIFDKKLFDTSKEKHEDGNMSLPIYYFSKIGLTQYKGKNFLDGDIIDIWSKNKIIVETKEVKEDKFKITKEMIQRWGKDKEAEDYIYLEEKYNELISVYDHRMPTQRWSYETIVKTKLESEKALEREDYAMYDKLTDRVQKLQNDSNIKPIQYDDSSDLDTNLPGYWAKVIQNDDPIPNAVGVFADPDRIGKLFDNQFIKTMQNVLGVGE